MTMDGFTQAMADELIDKIMKLHEDLLIHYPQTACEILNPILDYIHSLVAPEPPAPEPLTFTLFPERKDVEGYASRRALRTYAHVLQTAQPEMAEIIADILAKIEGSDEPPVPTPDEPITSPFSSDGNKPPAPPVE